MFSFITRKVLTLHFFSKQNKLIAVSLCFLFAILPLLYSICGYSIISTSRIWNPSLMFGCLVVEGRFAFFLNATFIKAKDSCSSNYAPTFEEISILDVILAALALLMETSRQVIGFYSDFFPLICCLSLWTCTGILRDFIEMNSSQEETDLVATLKEENYPLCHYQPRMSFVDEDVKVGHKQENDDFNKNLVWNGRIILPYITSKSSSAPEAKQVKVGESSAENGERSTVVMGRILLERYEICKSFSRTMNRALGQFLFTYVLSSIMYLSTCMDAVLVLQDWFGKLRVAFFFAIFILMFFIGSNIVNKVCHLFHSQFTPSLSILSKRKTDFAWQFEFELTCKNTTFLKMRCFLECAS